MIILRYIIPPLLLVTAVYSSTIIEDYEECEAAGFGREELVCDSEHLLANDTKAHLRSLLNVLQDKVRCECSEGCVRDDGNDKYIGLLMVTTSEKVEAANETLNDSAKYIYDHAHLGNQHCDNGLLIIYIKDKKELATYRGSDRFILLNSTEVAKLHALAAKLRGGDHSLGIQYLLDNDQNERAVAQADILRAESWPPLVGLLIAVILVLLVLGILLAFLLARYCFLCAKRNKKDTYRVSSTPTYKTVEPIFMATPSPHERFVATQQDAIYSTPYSGTPIPPPHFAQSRFDFFPGSPRSANASQSVTPLSTHKHRIHSIHGPFPRGLTPPETPAAGIRPEKVDDSTQTNGLSTIEASRQSLGKETKEPKVSPAHISEGGIPSTSSLPAEQQQPQLQPRVVSNIGDHDLSFLDPRRPLEVQTRTDYIY